ncbi:uncharacterized protein BDW70DRAFT_127734 [Aspergillus foveolatus]|uniref:uncharacterized protein n=1 Tax=Aspergillus foveolatus TaxID=210207 RepID=UPI003CCDFEF7
MSVTLGVSLRCMPARLAARLDLVRLELGWNRGTVCSQAHYSRRRWAGTKTTEATDRRSACTWLTTTPEQLSSEDILSSFPTELSRSTLDYIPVLLFTPAFAHWADAQGTFFEQCLSRLYQKTSDGLPQLPIHAICAIIDRLPYYAREHNAFGESEGVSIILARRDDIQGKAATPRQIRLAETEEPTLLFSFREDIRDQSLRQPFHEIGLRLANTIFLNGKENTLFGTRWAYDTSSRRLKLEKLVDLSTCSVMMTPNSIRSSLDLPLYPIGERRKVISSMGNILRQVTKHADGKSDESMPASSELEKVLPRYISENDIADRRVTVWALIEKTEKSPYAKSNHSPSSLAEAIQNGAKLHRVMSGGGGWGKKQGLLSLDPEMSFGELREEDIKPLHQLLSMDKVDSAYEAARPPELPMFLQDLSKLSQAAEPGDYVQFFASVAERELYADNSISTCESSGNTVSCCFGVMSDADMLSSHTVGHKNLTVVPNHFGALSEKAITYLQPLAEAKLDTFETHTKVDVPGSRLALILE